jgi:hypothetical protein
MATDPRPGAWSYLPVPARCPHERPSGACADCATDAERRRALALVAQTLGHEYQHGVVARLKEAIRSGTAATEA